MRHALHTASKLIVVDDAATAVEYALMVAFIALAIVAGATVLGISVDGMFQNPTLQGALK